MDYDFNQNIQTSTVNQFNWTYLADNGSQHQVVLMHGATSGHLLVYCNTSILLIDFGVLKTSSYSFFIEEELCELTIEREGDQFLYGFDVNRDADTPLNNARKKKDKKYMYQSIFFLGGLMLLVSMFIVGLTYYHRDQDQSKLLDQLLVSGEETTARILIAPDREKEEIDYFFFANGSNYSNSTANLPHSEKGQILLKSGMPLENGDEFLLRFLPQSPQRHLIDLDRPSPQTLQKYEDRAIYQYRLKHPEDSPEKARCLLEIAFSLRDIDAYALFYFSDTSPRQNPKHNRDNFHKLIRDLPFQKAIREKCQNL